MSTEAMQAYLDLVADDRFEARVPRLLKRHAETVARARGESLSEYVVEMLAARVSEDIVRTQEWRLTTAEQAELLRALSTPPVMTAELEADMAHAAALFGPAAVG